MREIRYWRGVHVLHSWMRTAQIEAGQWWSFWREKLWIRGYNYWPVPRELRDARKEHPEWWR